MEDKMEKGKNIHQRIMEVRRECEKIPENGVNKEQGYRYVMAKDLFVYLRKLLSKHGIDFVPYLEKIHTEKRESIKEWKGNKKTSVITGVSITMKYIFINVDNPSDRIEYIFEGYGQDYGDKAIWKAYTGTMKYFLSEVFMIGMTDDPEAETVEEIPMPQKKLNHSQHNQGRESGYPQRPPTPTANDGDLNTKIVGCLQKLVGDDVEKQKATFSMASAFISDEGEIKTLKTLLVAGKEKWKQTSYGKLKRLCEIEGLHALVAQRYQKELWDLTPEERDSLLSKKEKKEEVKDDGKREGDPF